MTAEKTKPGTAPQTVAAMNLDPLSPAPGQHQIVPANQRTTAQPDAHAFGFGAMHEIPIELRFEVGRVNLTIGEYLALRKDTIVELSHVAVDAIEVRVDEVVIGHGEMITFKDTYGVRIRDIVPITDSGPESLP